jgi:uncharacterized protein (TIGR00288 family)
VSPADGAVVLAVDGPNILRDEFSLDLDEIREHARGYGQLAVAAVYLDDGAPSGLIRAAEARGFRVVTTSGDVDVRLAVDVTHRIATAPCDTLVIVSRDTDFKPVIEQANAAGIHTVAIAPGTHGRSDALRHAAAEALVLDPRGSDAPRFIGYDP